MDEAVGQWYMRHVQGKLKEGKRSVRQTLAQNDKIIEVFRQHKDGLRMQLLLGDAEERASILRVAFLVRLALAPLPFGIVPQNQTFLKPFLVGSLDQLSAILCRSRTGVAVMCAHFSLLRRRSSVKAIWCSPLAREALAEILPIRCGICDAAALHTYPHH